MKLFYVRLHGNNPPMIMFGETRAKVGRLVKKMLGAHMVDEVVPVSRQDAEAEFGRNYMQQARWNMLRSEDMSNTSVLTGNNPFLREKINVKKADMGDVIDDFRNSDAPQFRGKSDAKKRQMAIAAKLQAEEDNFKLKKAKERLNDVIKRHEDAAAHHDAMFKQTGDNKHKNRQMFHKQSAEIATKKYASLDPNLGEQTEYNLSHLIEGVDQKVLKTFKTMLKDGEEDSVRLLLQGMPKHTKKMYMSRLGLKESEKIDGRTKAFRETISRLNMAKVKTVDEDLETYKRKLQHHDWHHEYSDHNATYEKGYQEKKELESLAKKHDPDHKIWNQHAPSNHQRKWSWNDESVNEEEQVKENISNMPDSHIKFFATKNISHGRYTRSEIDDEHKRRQKVVPNYQNVKPSINEEELDELSYKTMNTYYDKAKRSLHQARKSHDANILRSTDPSKDKNTVNKRAKGIRLAKSRTVDKIRKGQKEDLDETLIKLMVKDKKLPNLKVPNPNHKRYSELMAMLDKKSKQRSADVYREEKTD